MNIENSNNRDDYWITCKKIQIYCESLISPEFSFSEFVEFLNTNKQRFVSLLQNPPKNAKHREDLCKGISAVSPIAALNNQVLSSNFIQEAFILSDMYNLNELAALDLLIMAECQLQFYPGMTRGLVAVMIYYESQCALVKALKSLVQLRKGVWWKTTNYSDELIGFVSEFLNDLVEKHSLFDQIFQLLNDLDLSNELDLLQSNRAIGPAKHCSKVIQTFRQIRQNLAEIVYLWSAQTGLKKEHTMHLIRFLENIQIISDKGNEVIDDVNLLLQMALVHAIDLSTFNFHKDLKMTKSVLPIFTENDYLEDVLVRIKDAKFKSKEIEALSMFTAAICAGTMRHLSLPNVNLSLYSNFKFTFIDLAMKANIFDVLTLSVFENDMLFREEFLVRRMHYLITDFITKMTGTLKQMKIVADKVSQTTMIFVNEGLQAPSDLSHGLEKLLLMMAAFYNKEANRHKLDLGLDYWQSQNSRQSALNKFLTTVNDDGTPILFVPHLKLLSSLSSKSETVSRLTFDYLKRNEFETFNVCKVSWDHFFHSFQHYFRHLRNESMPRTDTVYQQFHKRGIKPHEIRGLHAVLELIRAIADADDFSRVAIVQHPGWSVITNFFGLIGCAVPIYLKADILLTLASLAKSAETAFIIWNSLENSQILPTIPSTSAYQPRGIKTELDEIETPMEKYPLTIAMLTLINTLVEVAQVPPSLGLGLRKPGFDPYFNFILDSILMKFHSRPYRDTNEKWQVAQLCLKLMNKLLEQYHPQPSDFATNRPTDASLPIGFHIMLQFCTNTELFPLIMFIIDNAAEVLDVFNYTTGTSWLEKCTYEALLVIENCLKLETKFFEAASSNNVPNTVLTKVHQLLYSVNPRSGKADYLLRISKYLQYQAWLPAHSLIVVNILIEAMEFSHTNKHLINLIMYDNSLDNEFRLGFVECLDISYSDYRNNNKDVDEDLVLSLKINIIKLLKQSFQHMAPNLTHYLFGFDIRKDIMKTVFEQAGFNNCPRTCLHSIFDLINNSSEFTLKHELVDQLFHLIYLICADPITCNSMLRFIRSQTDFITRNLLTPHVNDDSYVLNKNAWLMKIIAIEIRICAKKKQLANFNKIGSFLLGNHMNSTKPHFRLLLDRSDMFLLKSLAHFSMCSSRKSEMPKCNYFDGNLLKNLLKQCMFLSNSKVSVINMKRLHEVLNEELNSVQSSLVTGDRQLILKEIRTILDYAYDYNKEQHYFSAVTNWIDGWRQIVTVFFNNYLNQSDLLTSEERQILILRILEIIYDKIHKIDYFKINHLIQNYLSESIVILLDILNNLSELERKCNANMSIEESCDNITEGTICKNLTSLRKIFMESIEWLIENDLVNIELKTNLYLVLISILKILGNNSKKGQEQSSYISPNQNRNLNWVFNIGKTLEVASDIISSYGNRLIKIVLSDCITGDGNATMLAMNFLQQLLSLAIDSKWIEMAYNKGYLKYLVESLFDSDKSLKMLLVDDIRPESLRGFYLYETKLALLSQIACAKPNGAEILLELKIVSYLSSMSVLDNHPEVLSYNDNHAFNMDMDSIIPSITRYHQILFPVLNFCHAILNNFENTNQAVINQILYFLISRFESFQVIFRTAHLNIISSFMKELALITGLIARTASPKIFTSITSNSTLNTNRAHLNTYHKYMINLLYRFAPGRNTIKSLKTINVNRDSYDSEMDEDRFSQSLQVMHNLIMFIRRIMKQDDLYDTSIMVIFSPVIDDKSIDTNIGEQTPSIGIIVRYLVSFVHYYHEAKSINEMLQKRQTAIPTMTSSDLKMIVENSEAFEHIDMIRIQAYDVIHNQILQQINELKLCSLIISQCTYILWCHLDYYMSKAVPSNVNRGGVWSTISEINWQVSVEQISVLKKKLVSIFNDDFCKQLINVSKDEFDNEQGVVEALIRRIKRLIQFVPIK